MTIEYGQLEIELAPDGDTGVSVALSGELDISTMGALRETILAVAQDTVGTVLLDLTRLQFMDCTGLRSIVEAIVLLGDRLVLTPAPPQVQRLFTITSIGEAFSIQRRTRPRLHAVRREPADLI